MGVKNYLIEGVSGVGKTAAAEELQRRGYHVIHGDRVLAYVGDPETGVAMVQPHHESSAEGVAWLNKHWIWPVETVKSLIADQTNAIIFFCGASRNSNQFIDLFDEVFILNVDTNTLKRRLARRPEDEFGGRQIEQELISRLHATREDIPKDAVDIDATAPVHIVVDDILLKCAELSRGQSSPF
jgi:adenylate kinase family enzyme